MNKLLKLEVKNFLIKAVAARINCYKITYIANFGARKESFLDKYREEQQIILKNSLETLEFAFIVTHPGEKIKTEIIIGVRPIISLELERDVLYSNLNEIYMYYNNIVIKKIIDFDDVYNNIPRILYSRFSIHTFVFYSNFFQQMSASLCDFTMGYFEKNKDQLRDEYGEYSEIKGNYSLVFDEYSMSYLIKIFLDEKKMILINNKIYYVENKVFFMDLKNFIINHLENFIHDKFFFQTNLLDLNELIIRNLDSTIVLLNNQNGYINGSVETR